MEYKDLTKEQMKAISLFNKGEFEEFKEFLLSMNRSHTTTLIAYLIDNENIYEIQDKLGIFLYKNFKEDLKSISSLY